MDTDETTYHITNPYDSIDELINFFTTTVSLKIRQLNRKPRSKGLINRLDSIEVFFTFVEGIHIRTLGCTVIDYDT